MPGNLQHTEYLPSICLSTVAQTVPLKPDTVKFTSLAFRSSENKTAAGFNVGAWLAEHPADGTDSLAWSLEAVARGDVRVDLTAVGGHEQLPQFLEALERGETTGKLAVRFVSP